MFRGALEAWLSVDEAREVEYGLSRRAEAEAEAVEEFVDGCNLSRADGHGGDEVGVCVDVRAMRERAPQCLGERPRGLARLAREQEPFAGDGVAPARAP